MSKQEAVEGGLQTGRNVNEQLRIMGAAAEAILTSGKIPEVSILGINALGPLHQGLKQHRELLRRGSHMRILLLDPESDAFKQRVIFEDDQEARLNAEMRASFSMIGNLERTREGRGNLRVRLTDVYPDRSLIIVNGIDDRRRRYYSDAVVLFNPYPNLEGSRGLEGEMSRSTLETNDDLFNANILRFESRWGNGSPIKVVKAPPIEVFSYIPEGRGTPNL